MKKSNYLAALAVCALTLTSCSSDEVLSSVEQPGAIGFNAMANKSSRAGEVTTANIDRFRVFGWSTDASAATSFITLFDNVTVTKTENSTDWTYQNTQYWAPSKDYYFVAISTNNATPAWNYTAPTELPEGSTTATFTGAGKVSTSISGVNADRDLVYAYAARTTDADITDASKVPFTFNHMLSRIGVTFMNAFTDNSYTIVVSNVKIGGLINGGEVELGADPKDLAWTAAEGAPVSITATVASNNALGSNNTVPTDYKFIIPGEQTVTIEFDVEVKLNGQSYSKRTITGSIAAKEYKPGMSYMFNAAIDQTNIIPGGAKPIEFTVTEVTGWGTDEGNNVTFPENTTEP